MGPCTSLRGGSTKARNRNNTFKVNQPTRCEILCFVKNFANWSKA
jgi:hypothetical protein